MQNTKIIGNMKRHSTKAEISAREDAENSLHRDSPELIMPGYMRDCYEAVQVWERVCLDAEDIQLYDQLDADALATYCMITARVNDMRAKRENLIKGKKSAADVLEYTKEIRMQESLQLQFAGKLGLTPESRARLAYKRAAEDHDPSDELYG